MLERTEVLPGWIGAWEREEREEEKAKARMRLGLWDLMCPSRRGAHQQGHLVEGEGGFQGGFLA